MSNSKEKKPYNPYLDDEAKEAFEFLLPELASTVDQYLPSAPGSVMFETGAGNHFIWCFMGPRTRDIFDQRWRLEMVGRKH